MNESNRTPLVIAFVVVVLLFLGFGYGSMGGSMMNGGMTGQDGWTRGFGWIWIPTLLTLGIGVLLGRMAFGQRRSDRCELKIKRWTLIAFFEKEFGSRIMVVASPEEKLMNNTEWISGAMYLGGRIPPEPHRRMPKSCSKLNSRFCSFPPNGFSV